MNRTLLAIVIALLAFGVAAAWFLWTKVAVTHIEYLGERFSLPRSYWTYEAYRNGRDNLGPENLARIQALVQTRSLIGPFASDEAFGRAAGALKVPGYGMAGIEVKSQSLRSVLVAIEIPGTANWRYLLATEQGNELKVADDFVWEKPRITKMVLQGQVAKYFAQNHLVREQPL